MECFFAVVILQVTPDSIRNYPHATRPESQSLLVAMVTRFANRLFPRDELLRALDTASFRL
jgi:hypothetical protein